MRPDSYKKEEAEKLVVAAEPNWLVIGFQSDGLRGIPHTFNMVAESSHTNEGVYAIIRKLEPPFRVFTVGSEYLSWQEWLQAAQNSTLLITESEERELLQKLKAKYEK